MPPRMISYAQNGEDVVLARAFRGRERGFYVDIGANHPTHDSVTRHFYDLGWTGVNVEPQTNLSEQLRQDRPRDSTVNVGVGAAPATLDFYFVPDANGMSSFSAEHAALVTEMGYRTEQMTIEVVTLDRLFADHTGVRTVDFLKVDVEGFEDAVLDGFDWTAWRPRVVLVESSPAVSAWEARMLEHGYRRTLWDGINLFFVRDEDADELGDALRSPAVPVLDRYDPWYYVEQLERARESLRPFYRHFVAEELRARGGGADLSAAATALAEVLAQRPDVTAAFGTPPQLDVGAVLSWAGEAPDRPTEPLSKTLLPHAATYARLAQTDPSTSAGADLRTRVTTAARSLARQTLPEPVRHRLAQLRNR